MKKYQSIAGITNEKMAEVLDLEKGVRIDFVEYNQTREILTFHLSSNGPTNITPEVCEGQEKPYMGLDI